MSDLSIPEHGLANLIITDIGWQARAECYCGEVETGNDMLRIQAIAKAKAKLADHMTHH